MPNLEIDRKLTGLSDDEVIQSRKKFGSNQHKYSEKGMMHSLLMNLIREPMIILLLSVTTIYIIMNQYKEGMMMFFSVIIVAAISVFQEYRSRNAVEALKKLSAPKSNLIRNEKIISVLSEEIVTEDIMLIKEGELISADGLILASNDLFINESLITGEAFPVNKYANHKNMVYKGTLVVSGSATIKVTDVGSKTMLGKIGGAIQDIMTEKTPLQKQIRSFVRNMILFGAFAFIIVVVYEYQISHDLILSLIGGLTLAMSILPEEIPVAFTTFQALGAYRLLKNNSIIVKQPQYVETLGSATVICADKTGTITQNLMSVEYLYDASAKKSFNTTDKASIPVEIVEYAMWASETDPFDPMEKSIHQLYEKITISDKRKIFRQIHEYPFGGQPPLMTHIFSENNQNFIIAAKGSPEAIMKQSELSVEDYQTIENISKGYAANGYRVLGVGKGSWKEKHWPATQQEFIFEFLGLIAFQDPPKENISKTIEAFHQAGIGVKMITGDYPETALAIAKQINLNHDGNYLTGQEILSLNKKELGEKVKSINIFARMFPEAKLKIINVLKENGEIVAMTGDGVNDGPALKAAHIGIAMGKRGSEVAKNAASLILTDDDLSHMTDAVAMGRRIYDNLKKAIRYIVSIHVPIILIVLLPLLLGWKYSNIFSPIHVIFLELIMGPTCSIIYENEPMEKGTMNNLPRKMGDTFFTWPQISISIFQGMAITMGCLTIGMYFMSKNYSEEIIRTVVFFTLLFANVFLTLVNRSFTETIFKTIFYKNNLILIIILSVFTCIITLNYLSAATMLFKLCEINPKQMMMCIGAALLCTIWIEPFKWLLNKKSGQ